MTKQIVSDEELADAFSADRSDEKKKSIKIKIEDKPDIELVEEPEAENEDDEGRKKHEKSKKSHKSTILSITLIIIILAAIGAVIYTKFEILDKKDDEIALLNADNELNKTVIEKLGIDLNQFSESLTDANENLEETAKSLKDANSTLNFLLGTSASQLVSKYLGPFSGWSSDFSKFNLFQKGVIDEDYKRYITLYNSQFEGKYDEKTDRYISNLKYNLANETHKKLFGSNSELKEEKSNIKWCNGITNAYFDLSLYEGTGGFEFISDYDAEDCELKDAFFYAVDSYEASGEGFVVKVKIAFATKKENEKGESLFEIKLLDGETTEWGGPSCRTSSDSFIEENKDNLPTYLMNFKKDGENYYLYSIEKA